MYRCAGTWAGRFTAVLVAVATVSAQSLPPAATQQAPPAQEAPLLSPPQLDNLVAPVALYPDQLLSQILAASTYPLEIIDAEQWMQQNRNLSPAQLVSAAMQQNWDPSVQALVAMPDVLDILARDIHWTTDLGNAFLAQQGDVMNAVQEMRARAQQSGQLRSTPQQSVNTQVEDGQRAIQIAPTDPQTVYVPVYQPTAIWGPPAYGSYPSLYNPPAWGAAGFGAGYGGDYGGGYGGGGIGFSPGIFLGRLFSGLLSVGGWGWGLNWFAHALFLIPQFFSHFGFHGGGYGGYGVAGYDGGFVGGRPLWFHDPGHRRGVPYVNRVVATRFGGNFANREGRREVSYARGGEFRGGGYSARTEAPRLQAGGAFRSEPRAGNQFAERSAPQAARGYGGESFRGSTGGSAYSTNRGFEAGRSEGFRPQASPRTSPQTMARSFSAPRGSERQNFSARESHQSAPSQHFSAPHYSAPHNSAPHVSAPHGSSSHAPSSHGPSSHGSSSHGSGGGHSSGHSHGHH